jgi:hypothetical protein
MAKVKQVKVDSIQDHTFHVAALSVDQIESHLEMVEGGDMKAISASAWEMVLSSIHNGPADSGLTVKDLKKMITYEEFNILEREILNISGFRKLAEGELQAADQSTSNTSAAG